jgi:TRAP-type C4-dicarboxylate transport system substrate-binding protein
MKAVKSGMGFWIRAFSLLVLASLGPRAQAQVTIKMATLVPENSSWHLALKEMGDTWNRLSGGRVRIVLYPGGRQGDDADVVRKMHLGTLQGAVLTSPGLAEIDRSVYALSIPMAFESYEELYDVLERMRPRIESQMEAKGFVVINWADGGWTHFFAKKPVTTPDDLRHLKLFQWAGDPRSLEIWKAAGFNPRPTPSTELATGLQTGLLEAFLAPPQMVVITRFYEQARYMTDLKWAIILGATVVKKDVWAKVPPELRPALLQAARETGAKLQAEMRVSGDRDIQAMRRAGLTVVPVDGRTRELWRKSTDAAYGKIRGDFVPADAYDEALRHRDAFRRKRAGNGK